MSGALLVQGGTCQKTFQHCVPSAPAPAPATASLFASPTATDTARAERAGSGSCGVDAGDGAALVEVQAGRPVDLPAVALGVGDVAGAAAPRAVHHLADLARALGAHGPDHLVDLIALVDVEGEGVPTPAALGERLARRSLRGQRSEERRVGKEGVRTCRLRWWAFP